MLHIYHLFLGLFALVCLQPSTSFGQSAKTDDIHTLLSLAGNRSQAVLMINQMMEMYKQQDTGLTDTEWDEVKLIMQSHIDELMISIVPIYEKHYTHAEIMSLIAFYQSTTGKSLVKKTPLIMQESMQAGQAWGLSLQQHIMNAINGISN